MFEEVPRERRGVARLVPMRRIVLGPFVLGGGMLLAALGGSVAVAAAAATMITASAITSNDVPAHPGHPVSSSSNTRQTLAPGQPAPHHRTATPSTAAPSAVPQHGNAAAAPSVPHVTGVPGSAAVALPAPARTLTIVPPPRTTGPSAAPSSTAVPSSPVGSSSAPLGNAVIHVSGYDQAGERLSYQFASVRSGGGIDGGGLYQVLDSHTYTAALAPSMTITSGGGICLPAGSACTRDQLIAAADSGFFAVAAIDAQGAVRSLIEVGRQVVTPKLTSAPSTPPVGANSRWIRPGTTSPAPSSSTSATS